MSHHVYTTRGIVLALYPSREVDKTAVILTRDLGLVFGTARGMRKISSKLGSALLELSIVKVSLVKGKGTWRVTTVTLIRDSASELRLKREALKSLHKVALLVRKLVRGEEKHPNLYDEFEASAIELLDTSVSESDILDWELYTVARVLSELGYLSKSESPQSLSEAREKRKLLLKLVNDGIKESGLS